MGIKIKDYKQKTAAEFEGIVLLLQGLVVLCALFTIMFIFVVFCLAAYDIGRVGTLRFLTDLFSFFSLV